LRKYVEFILVLGLCPITVLVIKHFMFNLEPLTQWTFPVNGLGWAVSEAGALVAFWWPKKNASNWKKIWTLLLATAVTLLLVYLYHLAMETPPAESWVAWYNAGAFACYFITYVAFGYVLARVFTFIIDETFEYFKK